MFPLNTIIAWSINIIMNKKYDNNNIIIGSRAYFLQSSPDREKRRRLFAGSKGVEAFESEESPQELQDLRAGRARKAEPI
jgi:hypothetical protein